MSITLGRLHVEPVRAKAGDARLGRHSSTDRDAAAARCAVARKGELRRVGAGVARLTLDEADAARLREGAGIDEVDPLGRDRLEQAAQHRGGEWRASCSASSPAISSVSVLTPPGENCAKKRPRISPSGEYGRWRGPSPA